MAVSSDVCWECRTGGHNDNGGGFKAGASGTDRSLQTSPHATLTTAATVHTTTTQINVPAGEHTVSAADIGNILKNTGGSSTAGRYEITAVDIPNNRWTVDRSVGTAAQTVAGRMGGCVIDVHEISSAAANGIVQGQKCFVQAGTYNRTATTTIAVGAEFNGTTERPFRIIGYNATRGDTPTGDDRPLINLQTNTGLYGLDFSHAANGYWVENIRVDCNGLGTSIGIGASAGAIWGTVINCKVQEATSYGMYIRGESTIVDCEVTATTSAATASIRLVGDACAVRCWSHDNTNIGFYGSGKSQLWFACIASNNSGATSDGFQLAYGFQMLHCVAHGNGRDGLRLNNDVWVYSICQYNLFTSNTGYGINALSNNYPSLPLCDYNAFRANGTATHNGFANTTGSNGVGTYTKHDITVTNDPYVNAAGNDFRLNEDPLGGQLCRDIGIISAATPTLTSYRDVGAYGKRPPANAGFQIGI